MIRSTVATEGRANTSGEKQNIWTTSLPASLSTDRSATKTNREAAEVPGWGTVSDIGLTRPLGPDSVLTGCADTDAARRFLSDYSRRFAAPPCCCCCCCCSKRAAVRSVVCRGRSCRREFVRLEKCTNFSPAVVWMSTINREFCSSGLEGTTFIEGLGGGAAPPPSSVPCSLGLDLESRNPVKKTLRFHFALRVSVSVCTFRSRVAHVYNLHTLHFSSASVFLLMLRATSV